MYSDIKADPPYDQHLPYFRPTIDFKIVDKQNCPDGLEGDIEALLRRNFYALISDNKLDGIVLASARVCPAVISKYNCRPNLDIYRNISAIPAYPAELKLEPVRSGLFAKLECSSGKIEAIGLVPVLDEGGLLRFGSNSPNLQLKSFRNVTTISEGVESQCSNNVCETRVWPRDNMGSMEIQVESNDGRYSFLVY